MNDQPKQGTVGKILLKGAAIAAVIDFSATCFLNLRDLRKSMQAGFVHAGLIRPLAAILVMCVVLWGSIECLEWILIHSDLRLSYRVQETLAVLAAILIAAIIYFIVLLRTGSVTKADLQQIPSFESKVLPYLQKLHLL